MKVLWANRYCLLDTSSGASRSVCEMLNVLAEQGHDVRVVGATIFDTPIGATGLGASWAKLKAADGKIVRVKDRGLVHQLVKTADTTSGRATLDELNTLYGLYRANLKEFAPDVVFFYGGNSWDMLIPSEAQRYGAVTVAYLANPNYKGERWSDDVDLIVTDSRATAEMYGRDVGLDVISIGKFIDPTTIIAPKREPKHVTFINPSIEKGALLVAQLALALEKKRKDIIFEVVESRGNWDQMVQLVQGESKRKRKSFRNVTVTPNASDMRPIYARARALLVPSLWFESGARVIAEATLNGIPVIATERGGNVEMMGRGGIKLKLPDECYEAPYNRLLSNETVGLIADLIERMFDDAAYYETLSSASRAHGASYHNRVNSGRTLMAALQTAVRLKKKLKDHA